MANINPSRTLKIYNVYRAAFERASSADIVSGLRWYAKVRAELTDLARSVEAPTDVVVRVVAILSPSNDWTTNLKDAARYVQHWKSGRSMPSASTYGPQQLKAWNYLHGELNAAEALSGRKVSSFAANILGDDTVATIDRHMFDVARDAVGLKSLTDSFYRHAEVACRMLGSTYDIIPYQAQAVVWNVVRREKGLALTY